jgi:alpha-glucosidase
LDGFRFDTVNYFYHDRLLRDDAADYRVKPEPEANPYNMQYHLFSKNQPENIGWLERIRAVLDSYPARTSVGEVGETHHAIAMMGAYTAPGRLHQCYSFEMFGDDYSPAFFRGKIEEFFTGAPKGWPMWAFSNHDVRRHLTRWAEFGASPELLAKQAGALLLSFPGSICLWQGEELGQTDTELMFTELTDPQGIAFWPAPVGRDNTRTPMVWDASAHAGFTKSAPWLPVKPPQAARHVAGQTGDPASVLEHYRAMIAFRKSTPALRLGECTFLDTPDPVLAFRRGDALTCLFNLSPKPARVSLAGLGTAVGPSQACARQEDVVDLGPNGFGFFLPAG